MTAALAWFLAILMIVGAIDLALLAITGTLYGLAILFALVVGATQ